MDSARIEDLKRRIQKDPASIAFAQLGEEYRRAGRCREAIETCRAGLNRHPGYLSARVTLGRALLDVGELDQAESELKEVLCVAAENLAALRALAETVLRRGDRVSALEYYETALALAPRDLELQHTVASLGDELQRAKASPAQARPAPTPVPRMTPVPAATPASPSSQPHPDAVPPGTARTAPAAPDEHAERAVPTLERWLEAIVDDREHRPRNT